MGFAYDAGHDYVCYANRFLALSLSSRLPRVAHLGLESGGRTRRHLDANLLKPGLGGSVPRWAACKPDAFTVRATPAGVVYTCRDRRTGGRLTISFHGDKRIVFDLHFAKPASGDLFTIAFATDTAPMTTWATPLAFPSVPAPKPAAGQPADTTVRNAYRLPASLHFPDYGLLRLTCHDARVSLAEAFVQLREMQGLCLGYRNAGHHNAMVAYHHGHVGITLRAGAPVRHVTWSLAAEPEVYPRVRGCDFRDDRWNGLKRCWLNVFTLQKQTLTMGDNIALSGIAHLSMHFKSDMLLHTPPLPGGLRIQPFLRRALEISLTRATDTTGEINWEYLEQPGRRGEGRPGCFMDTTPSVLIAYANSFFEDGNRAFGRRHAAAAVRAARFLMAMDRDGDGIIESPYHGNRFTEDPHRTRNWWDNFACGHQDIYFNLTCHRALRLLVRVLEHLNLDAPARTEIAAFLQRFDRAFDRTFFNPATGVYAGWISRDGRVHDFFFTFASAMAINEGLVPRAKARRILRILLAKLQEAGFGDCRYGIPGPLVPVAARDTISWEVMGAWPRYENGGLCGMTAYHFLQALYATGLRTEADKILFAMLDTFEREPTHSGLMPGYARSVDWRTKDGHPTGYNYLADNYYFLLAAITGRGGKSLSR